MDYTPINWEDFPSQETPMNAYNLNHMDNQIEELSKAVVPIEANSEEETTEELKELKIGNINYKIPEGGGGGGTSVVANPTEAATDELKKLKVADTVYSIPEGGSGGGAVQIDETVLYQSNAFAQVINLADSIFNYDAITIEGRNNTVTFSNSLYNPSALKVGDVIGSYCDIHYVWYTITNATTLTFLDRVGTDPRILKITGVNFVQGGGGLPSNIILQGGESEETTPIPRDADLLGGHEPSYYATKTDLANIGTVKIGNNICDVVRIRKQSQVLKTEIQFTDFTTDLTTAQINKSKIMCGNVYIIDQNGVGAFAMGSLAQKADAVGVVTMSQSEAYYTILLTVFVAR